MRHAVLIVLTAAAVAACGSDPPVCGDAMPEGEEACDDGNTNEFDGCTAACTVRTATELRVEWSLLAMELEGFNESCASVTASKVQLDITGPETRTEMVDCSFMSTFVRGLTPGDYDLAATLLDSGGAALTATPQTASLSIVEGEPAAVLLDFPYDSFTATYTGTFFFRLKWASAATCAAPNPDVAQERVRIERDGTPLAGVYRDAAGKDVTITMDGQVTWPCRGFDEEFPHAVKSLAWGPARVTVTGLGAGGQALYEGAFDTFIGAGISNPEMTFGVPMRAPATTVAAPAL